MMGPGLLSPFGAAFRCDVFVMSLLSIVQELRIGGTKPRLRRLKTRAELL